MKAAFKELSVKSVSSRKHDLGSYISKCVFTLNGKVIATYSEPKEMSWYDKRYCSYPPSCTIEYKSEEARHAVWKLSMEYAKRSPLASNGLFDSIPWNNKEDGY